jgi:SRSO17 transposase
MNQRELRRLERDLTEFLDEMLDGLGRVERVAALRSYATGLLLDGERKSIEPIAGRLVDSPDEIQAMRQRLQQAVTIAAWSDAVMFGRIARKVENELPGVEALVIDDTGFAKKGKHSVGVARQYSGTLGRTDNCQVAVSLHLASEQGSACIAFDLYLPEEWTNDRERCRAAGVPDDVGFQTKHAIALQQLERAVEAGVRKHVVLVDAGYGISTNFRDELTSRGHQYVAAINGELSVWPPESTPRRTLVRTSRLATRTSPRYKDDRHPPRRVADLASDLEFRKVTWREGSRGWQSSRFAAVRVRTAHRHTTGKPPGEEQWLLVEWPRGDKAPSRFWFSTLPERTSIRTLVRLAKLRWRVERDYQELKQELGLDHYEGRTWRGFHHHATLCAAAHAFLALRRALFPPEQDALDDFPGEAGAPTDSHQVGGAVPALPPRSLTTCHLDGGVTDVIESY